MADSSNNPKHHSHGSKSKKISKKPSNKPVPAVSQGIATHEEAKLEVQQAAREKAQRQEKDFAPPVAKSNVGSFDSEDDTQDENKLEKNLEEVMKAKDSREKNQDKIAAISHYLILKNKINAKNAFDIPMLNVKEMSAFHKIEGEFSWKNLSSALEAGAKIYGFRVDSVHTETYKILGGLNRTELEEGKEGIEVLNEKNVEDYVNRKKHDFGDSKTLEKNINNINTQKYDLEFDVDPLFSKTSAKFDESGTKGLLLNNTSISPNMELLFDIQIQRKKSIEESSQSQNAALRYKDVSEIIQDVSLVKRLSEMKLCPELGNFKEEMRGEESIFNLSRYVQSAEKERRQGENPQAELDSAFKESNFFGESYDEPFLNEGEYPDDFAGPEAIPEEENEGGSEGQEPGEVFEEDDNNEEKQGPSDLMEIHSQFNFNLMQEKNIALGTGKLLQDVGSAKWMGPELWKIKMKHAGQNKTIIKSQPTKKKSKKGSANRAIEFDLSYKERLYDLVGSKKNLAINKVSFFQDSGNIRQSYLLPMDYHIDVNRLNKTFLKDPELNASTAQQEEPETDVFATHLGNVMEKVEPEEMEGIIVGDEILVIDKDVNPNGKHPNPNNNSKKKRPAGNKRQIPIKELKDSVWSKLESLRKFEEGEEEKDQRSEMQVELASEAEPSRRRNGYNFSFIVSLLPEIVGDNASTVSVQTCFVTMLHLANEKILRFSEIQEEDDFFVEREN